MQLQLSTVLAKEVIESQKITGLICRGVNETIEIPMPRTYTRRHIPASSEQIPRPESARAWPHLENIAEKLMPYRSDIEVGLLIGTSCIRAIKPREIIMGGNEDPFGKRTDLGWGIVGAIKSSKNEDCEADHATVNRVLSHEVQVGEDERVSHFAFKVQTKELLNPNQVIKLFEFDFISGEKEQSLSYDGHYEMPLPFKDDNIQLPDNKEQPLLRLGKLRQRLKNDEKYYSEYMRFMSEIISNGYAETVPEQELDLKEGRVWYLPHHGVYNS